MIVTETKLADAYIIELEPRYDERGFFSRAFCARELATFAMSTTFVQTNISYSHARGTLRGLHYQVAPAAETKLVRCIRGAICDVVVDLRPESPTYRQHELVELTADNRRSLYVPKMFAHGFQSLTDGAEVMYEVDEFYSPEHERGLRYDDPALSIPWPEPVTAISAKDRAWPLI